MIERELARMIGVAPGAPPQTIAEYLLRQGGAGGPIDRDIPPGAAAWFVGLAGGLHEWVSERAWWEQSPDMSLDKVATTVATDAVGRLHRSAAPAVLALIAPNQVVGNCEAARLELACKALVRRHCPGFCRKVLDTWEQDGQIGRRPDFGE